MQRAVIAAAVCAGCALGLTVSARGQAEPSLQERIRNERAPLIETLRELVDIESGSGDIEGLDRLAELIAARLRALGGEVELVPPPADFVRFENTPPQLGRTVVARFRGNGTRRLLLLAHMDTVYPRGALARQPFRIAGDFAYGAGIADDKHGVALILHALSILRATGFDDYELITVAINGDEEVSSAGSRSLITKLGAEHDVVLSCEGYGDDRLRLTTQGIAGIQLKVTGRASHAGAAPEQGRNALYELMHQIMQTRDLSDDATGVKVNWTMATAGSVRNVIPAEARATADVRVLRVSDYDQVERQVRERMRVQLIPDTQVDMVFERLRPPLEATDAARAVAAQAQAIYREIGRELGIQPADRPSGGTDAAFAALESNAAVVEGFGLNTFGAHSDGDEYVDLRSIEPRLFLLVRMLMTAR